MGIEGATGKVKQKIGDIFRIERLLLLFIITISLVMFGESFYGSFLNLFVRNELSAPLINIGTLIFIYAIAGSIVSIPAGYISDRTGRKPLITISLFILGIVVFLYSFVETTKQMYLLRGIHGAVIVFIFPIARAYVMDKTTEENRGRIMGTFVLIPTVISWAAPALGGFLKDTTGSFNPLFYIGAVFPIMAAVFLLTAVRELGTGFTVQKMRLPTKGLIRNRTFAVILLMFGLLYFASGILSPIMSIFANEELGMSYKLLGTLFTSMGIFYAFSQYIAGTLSDRHGRKNLLVYPLMIYAVSVCLAGLSVNYQMFFFVYWFVAIGAAPYSTVAYSLVGDVVEPEHRGTASGAITAASNIGMMLGPLVGSAIGQMANMRTSFFACSCVVVATIVMLFILLPKERGE
jgi:DHA1 family multidrug resistance protein-like MFS transporter